MLPKLLLVIILLGTLLGLTGIWFPDMMNKDVRWKLICTFMTLGAGVAIATTVMKYLPPSH